MGTCSLDARLGPSWISWHCHSFHRLEGLVLKGALDLTNPVRRLEDFQRLFPCGKTPLAGQLPPPPNVCAYFQTRAWREDRERVTGRICV